MAGGQADFALEEKKERARPVFAPARERSSVVRCADTSIASLGCSDFANENKRERERDAEPFPRKASPRGTFFLFFISNLSDSLSFLLQLFFFAVKLSPRARARTPRVVWLFGAVCAALFIMRNFAVELPSVIFLEKERVARER